MAAAAPRAAQPGARSVCSGLTNARAQPLNRKLNETVLVAACAEGISWLFSHDFACSGKGYFEVFLRMLPFFFYSCLYGPGFVHGSQSSWNRKDLPQTVSSLKVFKISLYGEIFRNTFSWAKPPSPALEKQPNINIPGQVWFVTPSSLDSSCTVVYISGSLYCT